MHAFEIISDVETESSAYLVMDPEVDNLIFLPEPTIEALHSHAHEACLRPNIHVVSFAYLL